MTQTPDGEQYDDQDSQATTKAPDGARPDLPDTLGQDVTDDAEIKEPPD
jgi:hypothetical protein